MTQLDACAAPSSQLDARTAPSLNQARPDRSAFRTIGYVTEHGGTEHGYVTDS